MVTDKKFDETGMVAKEYAFAKYPKCFTKWSNDRAWNWSNVLRYAKLSEDFIKEFADKVNWFCVSRYQHLSESFIREFTDRVDWDYISEYQRLSEDFIREYANWVNWNCISTYQHLGESFIREYANWVNWITISIYQHLSEDFIREFAGRVDWYRISKYQIFTPEFAKEMNISIHNNSRRTPNEWKELVKSTNLYECHDDYFVVYKGIRSDRYSKFNFQYRYLPGETYECFSDYSDDENSFGLSAWTEEKAKEYCSELVIKVRINYEDVTAVVHDGGKIRCKKLMVIN